MYDVASLIDDVRIQIPLTIKNKIFQYYLKKSSLRKDIHFLKNDFDILSIQRNLKILGIFYRLDIRDKKPQYLKYLPYTWKLIELRMKNNENSISFLISLGVKHIIINTHYLHNQISSFVKNKKFSCKIDLVFEKKKILNTGGGILNASKKFKKQVFFVLNPDTLWRKEYKKEFKNLIKIYQKNKKPAMLLIPKNKSFDKSFKGEFNLNPQKQVLRQKNNKLIFTGAQILTS